MTDLSETGPRIDREMYANWYEWAYRALGKNETKAHAAAAAAVVTAASGSDSAEIEKAARKAAKDQHIVGQGADNATKVYAKWYAWAVSTLGVSGEPAHRAAGAALTSGEGGNAVLAAERAAGVHGDASRADQAKTQREDAFARAQRECPFPIAIERANLPGGMQLMNDEFLVTSGRDWGFSSQKILITTHRAIWTHGRILNKQQNAIYLTDIRDVAFKKPLVGYGSIAFETSSGHVIEALPSVSNGAQVRNSLLTLIHYARTRAQQPSPQTVPVVEPVKMPAAAPQLDRYDQISKLGELKKQGLLSEEEFQAEKARILSS